ncbi:unnamed protein product [Lymnaea stagnalis]|uniref:cardiolipin synthase (CMP-forming) n=1 Tax=Lymnaea stagnalis TaxID=6523 RepID=A0AAV2H890_LYMST
MLVSSALRRLKHHIYSSPQLILKLPVVSCRSLSVLNGLNHIPAKYGNNLLKQDFKQKKCGSLWILQYRYLSFTANQTDQQKIKDSIVLNYLPSKCDREISTFCGLYIPKRSVGRSIRHNDETNNNSVYSSFERYKVRDRYRIILNSRISRLKRSIQNLKLREKWKANQVKGLQAVGRLKRTLKAKKEDIKTIPNLLTTIRMASAPVLAYLVVHDYFGVACTIFVLAGITDVLDGYVARNFKNQRTAFGTALDPLADKLLVSFLGVSLTSAGLIPVPMTVLILGRDAGLIVASFYIRYMSLAPPRTLKRYFDVSLVSAKLYPSNISKLNTVLQLTYVAATLASPVFDFVGHPLLQGFMYLTAATTFMSGVDYVLTWRRRLHIIKNN